MTTNYFDPKTLENRSKEKEREGEHTETVIDHRRQS